MTYSLIDEKQTAAMLGCSIHKLQKDRRIGSPIPYIKIGRSVKYRVADIEAYLEKQAFNSTSEYDGGDHG